MTEQRYKTIAARQIGNYHITVGLPCQDAVYKYEDDSSAVIVLADGAGSSEKSEIFSSCIVELVGEYLTEYFDELYREEPAGISRCIRSLADQVSKEIGVSADCTLLAYARKDEQDILIHVGDGIILGVGERARVLSWPENGDYSNETFFLSGPNTERHLRVQKQMEEIDTVLMCSDGISNELYNKATGEIARAVYIFREWLCNYPEDQVEKKMTEELVSLFSIHTEDDMSIAMLHWKR